MNDIKVVDIVQTVKCNSGLQYKSLILYKLANGKLRGIVCK